jgi:hypothetical protein
MLGILSVRSISAIDVPEEKWNAAIDDLVSRGMVERQGECWDVRYRAVQGVEE